MNSQGMQVQEIGGHRFYVIGEQRATEDQQDAFERETADFAAVRIKGLVEGWVVYEVRVEDAWHYHSIAPDGIVHLGGNPPYPAEA